MAVDVTGGVNRRIRPMHRAFKCVSLTASVLLFQGEDSCNMDGFYDQQVPFVVPESVSFKH